LGRLLMAETKTAAPPTPRLPLRHPPLPFFCYVREAAPSLALEPADFIVDDELVLAAVYAVPPPAESH